MKLAKLYLFFVLLCQSFFAHAQTVGSLQEVPGSPFPAGSGPRYIVFSPILTNGNLLAAVPNANDNTVSVYSVNPTTGAFTPVTGSPFPTGIFPLGIDFSPLINGNLFAAVTNSIANTVSVYSVNPTTGAFTPVTGSPFPTGSVPNGIEFSPLINGNLFAAVANSGSNTVSVYSVNPTTGAFTPVAGSPFPTGTQPIDVAFSPLVNGNLFASVVNNDDNTVSVYSVNTTTGAFTSVAGSPFPTGLAPFAVDFSPVVNGNLFAAVSNDGSDNVSVYSVNTTTGVFTPVPGSPFPTGTGPVVTFSPLVNDNLFAVSANFDDDTIFSYSVNTTTGAFTLIDSKPTESSPFSAAYSPLLTNGNLFVAVSNVFSDNISVYEVILPPTVTSVTPSTGPFSGGTTVIITGTQFTGATAVLFGTTPALSFVVDSENQITAVSPPGVGTVDVTVTTPVGTSAISAADQFTYINAPLPPRHLKGCQKVRFDRRKDSFINILTWKAPRRGTPVVAYQIYRDRSLTRLIEVVPNEGRLRFRDPVQKLEKTYTYFVVSVDEFGNISEPVKVKIRGSCGEECQR